MYVDVEFSSQGQAGLGVPEAAVPFVGERQYVFVPVY
jgi:hypothetical protein